MMNMTATSVNAAPALPAAGFAAAPVAPAGAPAGTSTAADATAVPAHDAAPAPAPFAQWLGLGLADAAPDVAMNPVPGAAADDAGSAPAPAPAGGDPGTQAAAPGDDAAAAQGQAPAADVPQLAAMAMPLMPVPLQQAVAAAQVAQAAAGGVPAISTPAAGNARSARGNAVASQPANAPDAPDRGAIALPSLPAQPAQPAAPEHLAVHAAQAAPQSPALAGADTPARQDSAPDAAAPGLQPALAAAPAPQPQQQAAGSVALAGPPTAWRQSLHEALGDRIDLQLAKNAEQAVIRLDPPNLGRIEIAIRHAAGSLQVTLTATHSEVVRQLQSVSDGLRNDLAQRQFTEVAVNVAPAPRGQSAAPFGGDAGRGARHGGRQQEQQTPGHALRDGEARSTSAFSLT